MGLNCFKAAEPLEGDSLYFNNISKGGPGTYLIDLGRMKDWVDFGATQCFELGTSGLGIQHPNH